ncbi:MAG: hypothetical protein HOM96_05670 [Rickettsiales bacterium]|jgi:hypothetical protein|nr:hypothetical protein [Rickettsiales bacterium]
MIKSFFLTFTLLSFIFNSTLAYAFNDIDEERYMLEYRVNSDMETSVNFNYQEHDINSSNILDRPLDKSTTDVQANYSGYKNVQGYKNTNKSKSKRFAGIAIGVIVTGIVLIGISITTIINAL